MSTKPKRRKPLSTGAHWDFDLIETYYKEIERIAVKKFNLDVYPNQIELISSEQMLDAYSSHGLPISYNHWSFGKSFVQNAHAYKKGQMGLAYEIVLNTKPCLSYLMEENTICLQALVMAHACFGHNAVFKNNYMFKQWTDAEAIIDYLVFAKKYITDCEDKYGASAVEELLDSCHALQYYGVDKYKRPSKISIAEEQQRQQEREEYLQSQVNDLWRTVPVSEKVTKSTVKRYPAEPQENLLYFFEKNAPNLQPWQREIIRIVRKISQYFYPQMQTKVLNEGYACVTGDTLIDTPNGLMRADTIVDTRYSGKVSDGTQPQQVTQWFDKQEKQRIKIKTFAGFELHGGYNHRILNTVGEWVELKDLKIGDQLPIVRGQNEWPKEYVKIPEDIASTRMSVHESCDEFGVYINTYYKWKNDSGFVSDLKQKQCESVDQYLQTHDMLRPIGNYNTRRVITKPTHLTEDVAFWLGLMVGDGNIHDGAHKYVNLTSGDEETRDWFAINTTSLFGVPTSIIPDRNHWKIRANSNTLVEYLVSVFNCKTGKAADIKVVPDLILQSPLSVVSAFLRGHFDTDGCVTKSGDIILVSKSEQLIKTEQQLLLKMGISSVVRLQAADQCYRLTILGYDTKLFNDLIGFFLPRKQDRLTEALTNKTRFLEKKDVTTITEIIHDVGPVYDFGVENTHKYKASCFINHNCFVHYNIINEMYNGGLVDDGFMLEFFEHHTNVVRQLPFNHKYYSGMNPYTLGFSIFMDIKRICENPTDEDREWFPDIAGTDWKVATDFAMRNFKDDSFIQQYLSPKVIRDLKLFSVEDDDRVSEYEITGIHNNQGYKTVRNTLAGQYNIVEIIPNIQVYDVDVNGTRGLTLRHYMHNERPLDHKATMETMKHVMRLWGFNVAIESVDHNNKVRTIFTLNTQDGSLLDVFDDD